MTPAVTVVIPAWNAAAFIDEALASLAAQTLADWEALVIDDVSSDDTASRVAAFAARDPRVRALRQSVNAGPSAARNRGFAEARGRYVALLDADDAYEPTRLSDLVALAERHGADLASRQFAARARGRRRAAADDPGATARGRARAGLGRVHPEERRRPEAPGA